MKLTAKDQADLIAQVLDDALGEDISIIELDRKVGLCDYFVITTARSTTHGQSLAVAVEEALEEQGQEVYAIEGLRDGQWILLDCDNVIVHIFTQQGRDYYDLDGLWK